MNFGFVCCASSGTCICFTLTLRDFLLRVLFTIPPRFIESARDDNPINSRIEFRCDRVG